MTQPAPEPEASEAPPPQTVPMQDRDGTTHQIPLEQAKEAYNSGAFGFVGPIRVKSPGGKVGTLDPANADKFFAHPDAQVASDEEFNAAELQKKYGGIGGQAATAALGAASGATLGLSDVAASALSPEARQYIHEHYEANPKVALGSKIGGAFLPGLVSGGAAEGVEAAELGTEAAEAAEAARAGTEAASAETGGLLAQVGRGAAKVAGAPVKLTEHAGSAVENVVSKLLGGSEEGSLITRLAKGAAAKGAGLGTEGAIYGMADQIDEDVLGDHELNAEKILASGLHGALLGGVTGGVLSSAGTLGQYTLGKLAPKIGGMAEEQAVRALEPKAAAIRQFDNVPGGAKGVGRKLLDEGLIKPGDTLEDIAPRITQAKEAAGEKIGAFLKQADEVAAPAPSVKEITERLQREVLAPLEKAPELNAAAIAKVKTVMRTAERFGGVPSLEEATARQLDHEMLSSKPMTFATTQDLKKAIGDSINWKNAGPFAVPDKANEAAQKSYGILSDLIEESGEKAADKLGIDSLADYKAAKLSYQQLKAADKAATNSLDLKAARNFASPSDKGAGLSVGAGLLAHGVGGIPALAASLATGAASKLARERVAGASAVLLDKLSALRGVERAAQTVDKQIDRGLSGIIGQSSTRVVPRKAAGFVGGELEAIEEHAPSAARDYVAGAVQANREKRDAYVSRVKAVQQAAGNIEDHAQGVRNVTSPIAAHAPKTAKAIESASVRAVQYLADQVPKREPTPSITPQFDKRFLASDEEQRDFIRKFDAVHDPASVLQDAAEGRLTRGQVDAIKQVLPKLYGEIVEKAQARLSDTKHPLSYSQKLQMGLLLGIPADPTMAPQFVSAMQQTYSTPGNAPSGQSPGAGKPQHRSSAHPIEAPAKAAALTIGGLKN